MVSSISFSKDELQRRKIRLIIINFLNERSENIQNTGPAMEKCIDKIIKEFQNRTLKK
jgi:hypothetical protein